MDKIFRLLLVLILHCLMSVYAAPLLSAKNTWNKNVFAPIIKATCSSDGQCWGWLPISESSDNTDNIFRLQSRRQITNPISKLESWKNTMLEETERQIQSPIIHKQIPTKKDVFISSRNWGGMPFSVLYMNSHNSRPNHLVTSTIGRQQLGKTTEKSTSLQDSNYGITLRNAQTTIQPRRQYSIIPQLFISYGWGSFGK